MQSLSTSQDAAGQPIETWVDTHSSEPAEFTHTAGGQSLRGRQVEEGITAVFTVNFRDGYSPTQRVVFENQVYGIIHVRPVYGRRRYIDLFCKSIES